MEPIFLHKRKFEHYLAAQEIKAAINRIGDEINRDYQNREPVFIGVLNGAFIFAADLFKCLNINCSISFVKLSSYEGTASTGRVKQVIGLTESLASRDVIILEDIIDTGKTVAELKVLIEAQKPASIAVATAFDKPACRKFQVQVDYTGISLPDYFVVGYGLDYDGLGRNLPDLYRTK